jgi:hypothetical protein
MKKLLFSVIATLTVMRALACSCPWPYEHDFYKNITMDHLFGVVVFDSSEIKIGSNGFPSQFGYVLLLDTFNNIGSKLGDTLTLVGVDGFNCSEDLKLFGKGDTLILALESSLFWGGQDTFYLNGCGAHYLRIHNGQHNGLTIPEIKDKIFDILLPVQDLASPHGLEVYPNPTYETLTIKAPAGKILRVDLMDVQGRWLFKKEDVQEIMELDLSGILPGLYLLRVETDLGVEVRKLIRY